MSVAERQTRWLLYGIAALGPIILTVLLIVIFTRGTPTSRTGVSGPPPKINYAALPGLQKGKAPWPPEYGSLPDRLKPLGLSALGGEAQVLHIHMHLDIFVNGKPVVVPKFIGIDDGAFLTELHTHDSSGIMHVESPTKRVFALGQFFGVWGLRLSKRCLGGYCATRGKPLRVWVNGRRYRGDPNNLVLQAHQVIVIAYGKPPRPIPSTYDFRGL
ncbi:MAG TPA: hypothetical protein VF002_00260 [Gaiellaceae bacterium]